MKWMAIAGMLILPAQVAAADIWTLKTDISQMDDSKVVTLHTKSKKPVRDKFKRAYRPTLWMVCREGRTNFYIDFGGLFMSSSSRHGEVTWRIDKDEPIVWEFSVSGDNQALGLWGGDSAFFIKKLIGKSRFLVRATPFSESPVETEFSLAGLDAKLPELRQACNW